MPWEGKCKDFYCNNCFDAESKQEKEEKLEGFQAKFWEEAECFIPDFLKIIKNLQTQFRMADNDAEKVAHMQNIEKHAYWLRHAIFVAAGVWHADFEIN